MRLLAALLACVCALMLASDVTRSVALHSDMRLMRLALRLNPYSFETRLDEIESLWDGYRQERKPEYLHEAVLIGRSLIADCPQNTLAWSVYSSALIFEATHGGAAVPIDEALHAVRLDPISVPTIERAMFLLASKRVDYGEFKQLGIARSRLTREPLRMTCELDGRGWLEHGK